MVVWSDAEDWVPDSDVDRGQTQINYTDDSVSLLTTDSQAFAITWTSGLFFIDVENMTSTHIVDADAYSTLDCSPDFIAWASDALGSAGGIQAAKDGTIIQDYESDNNEAVAGARWWESLVALYFSDSNDEAFRLNTEHTVREWEITNQNENWAQVSYTGVDSDYFYLLDSNNRLTALNIDTGNEAWSNSYSSNIYKVSSDGNYVYVGVGSSIRQLNQSNGSQNWSESFSGHEQSRVATDGTGVYTGYYGDSDNVGFVGKLDESGNIAWDVTSNHGHSSVGAGVGPDFALLGDDSTLRKYDKSDGTELGSVDLGNRVDDIACHPGGYGAYGGLWW